MGFDVVSLLSVCVFATLAIACTVCLTVGVVPLEPAVRVVQDVCTVRAPTILVNFWSTLVSNTSFNAALTALSARGVPVSRLVRDVFDVAVRLSPLQLTTRLVAFALGTPLPYCVSNKGNGCGSRRVALNSLAGRLVDYVRSFCGVRADFMSATPSVFLLWTTLVLSSILFLFVSLWILFSLEAPLDDNTLRLITTLNTALARIFKKINAYSRRVSDNICFVVFSLLAIAVLWPTSLLRTVCYSVPVSRRTAYLDGSLAGIRCDRHSFYDLYVRLGRLLLASVSRFLSLAAVTLILIGFAVYACLFLHAIWTAYYTRKSSAGLVRRGLPAQVQAISPASNSPNAVVTVSTDGLALRLMTSAWCSRHIAGDLLLATISEWFTWTILARCFISIIFVSLWILNSLTYSLTAYDLRLVAAFTTSLTRLIRKFTAYAHQLPQRFSLILTVLLSFGVIWPTSLLRAYCYSIPLSQRTAYLDGSAAGIRCDRDSFYGLYRRLGRLAIASTLRLLSRTGVTLIIFLMLVYTCLVLHAIWTAYYVRYFAPSCAPVYTRSQPSTYSSTTHAHSSSTESSTYVLETSDNSDSTPLLDTDSGLPTSASTSFPNTSIWDSSDSSDSSPFLDADSENTSCPKTSESMPDSSDSSDSTPFLDADSGLLIPANTLCSNFPEDYYIHPDFIARYELGSLLGRGGNGFVLQARRRVDDQQVAVKFVLKRDRAARWPEHPTYGRVSRDVIYMDLARHKNIISLLDVFSDDTYLYIVQELHGTLSFPMCPRGMRKWPNGSRCLASYIQASGRLPLAVAKHIFYQLVDAVAHLHSKGITHCDIKPENILIDTNTFEIKLIDLGNAMQMPAQFIGPSGSVQRVLDADPEGFRGTPSYTPPEILNGEPYERTRADIWAMGMVLCESIIGSPPFGTTEDIMMASIYRGWGVAVRQALLPVWYIVGSCLHWDYYVRPSAAELQLRVGYLPILLERQQVLGVDIEAHWADGVVYVE